MAKAPDSLLTLRYPALCDMWHVWLLISNVKFLQMSKLSAHISHSAGCCPLGPATAGDNANGRAAAKLQPLAEGMEIILSDEPVEPDSNVVWCLVYQLECVHFHSSAAGQQIVFVSVLGRDLVRLPCCCGQGRLGLGWAAGREMDRALYVDVS